MQHFTIKDIENLSGIKAHTLRIWEQRYNFLTPKRKQSLHRVYDNEDLKELLRISFLYHNGWKVSHIAALSAEQRTAEVRKAEITNNSYKPFVLQLIEKAIDFDEEGFIEVLHLLTQKLGFEQCITEVVYPYLQRIGLLWVTSNIIPAQEHFSSYLVQNKIIAETDKLPYIAGAPRIILFSPQGEHHELPLLFINYLLKKNGWNVLYLGSNIHKDLLKQFASADGIDYLFLHLITNFTGWDPDFYFEDLCKTFSNKSVVATGSFIQQMQRSFVNLKLLKTDKEIYSFIQKENQQ